MNVLDDIFTGITGTVVMLFTFVITITAYLVLIATFPLWAVPYLLIKRKGRDDK